jgi:hypothetical protein
MVVTGISTLRSLRKSAYGRFPTLARGAQALDIPLNSRGNITNENSPANGCGQCPTTELRLTKGSLKLKEIMGGRHVGGDLDSKQEESHPFEWPGSSAKTSNKMIIFQEYSCNPLFMVV